MNLCCMFVLVMFIEYCVNQKILSKKEVYKMQQHRWCNYFLDQKVVSSNEWFHCKIPIQETHNWPALANRTLRVAVLDEKSRSDCWGYDTKNGIVVGKSYGSFILRILQDIHEFKLRGIITYINSSFSQSEALKKVVASGEADIAICHLRILPARLRDVSFLHSTLTTTQSLIFTASHLPLIEDVFVLTFSGTLWLCFLLAIILLVVCFRFSTWLHSFVRPDHEPWSWMEVMLWAIAAVCQQSYSRHPKGLSCRTTFIIGYLITYLLYTGFAAGVTSLLAVQGKHIQLTLQDIVAMKLTLVYTPHTGAEYQLHQLTNSSTIISIASLEKKIQTEIVGNNYELFERLQHDNMVGIGSTIELEKFILNNLQKRSQWKYTLSQLPFSKSFEGMIVNKNSPLKEIFNFWLLRLQENGLLDLGRSRYVETIKEVCCDTPGWSSADLGNVLSALLILTTGYFFSVLILFFEMAWMRRKTGTKWEKRTKQDILRQYNKFHARK